MADKSNRCLLRVVSDRCWQVILILIDGLYIMKSCILTVFFLAKGVTLIKKVLGGETGKLTRVI